MPDQELENVGDVCVCVCVCAHAHARARLLCKAHALKGLMMGSKTKRHINK